MARSKPAVVDAAAEPERTVDGRRIAKRTFSLHKGSVIVRGPEDPDTPPESEVLFQARGTVRRTVVEYLANGTAEEATVLEVDGDSFEILAVAIHEPDPELPFDGEPAAEETAGQSNIEEIPE